MMYGKATADFEIKVSNRQEDVFVKVEASKLSLEDEFMDHKPVTKEEEEFKNLIELAIKKGLKDFWRPKYDPSLEFGIEAHICFKSGMQPAIGESYNWWVKNAKHFKPECKSRLGTKTEYIAFLAVLIKKMVSSDWTVSDAWHAVCNDSKKLGHYKNSEDAKQEYENTGSREICGFCDLSNTFKFVAEEKEETGNFWLCGGSYNNNSHFFPLADLSHCNIRDIDSNLGSVGWIVLEECYTNN